MRGSFQPHRRRTATSLRKFPLEAAPRAMLGPPANVMRIAPPGAERKV